MSMPLDLLIERWFAIGFLAFGLSHLLYPDKWTALFLPLRQSDTGGLLVATFTLPLGVVVVLAHNIWVWGLPVIVTLTGWAMIVKSLLYLLFPRAPLLVIPAGHQLKKGFRIAGVVAMFSGALLLYDSFYNKW
jgi:uncharacterized protein YjeT (DUF2065 family)